MELQDLVKSEKRILDFWRREKIFEKSLKRNKGKKEFVFYEGPPFANGRPGIHHLLARAFKDAVCRFKSMEGFYVPRKAGWDTHGLPTEISAEKDLKIKTKREIEAIGIEKFIEACKRNVFTYKFEWEKFTERMGFWIDLKNAYITCSQEYIEVLLLIFETLYRKGLIYEDFKVLPYCPRCQSVLSSHELAQGYRKVKEKSIYLKFKILKAKEKKLKNVSLLVWTTTPWTLPSNTAIALNPEIKYLLIKDKEGQSYLLAEKRAKELFEDFKVLKEFKGRELEKIKYEPPFFQKEGVYETLLGDFVSEEEGTGLVHIAPAFGEDDFVLWRKYFKDLNFPIGVDDEGKMVFPDFVKGKFVKEADPLIVEDLKKRKLLFKEELYEHDYPFCWRCQTPLIYFVRNSWFIKVTAKKEEIIKNNQKINWVPSHLKEGRFGQWLKELKDWTISRQRYWGAPIPVWVCEKCQAKKVIGRVKELEKLSGKKIKELHRPFIDEITFKCEKCGGEMRRVKEVVDCWYDSGAMPLAQSAETILKNLDEKFSFKKIIKKIPFPADFICEGIDQTRGWFYTLLVISTLLDLGIPYKNVISLGHVLDEHGRKMSKSRGNVVEPFEIMEKYGADAVRWYFYIVNPAGEPKRFSEKDLKAFLQRFLLTYFNIFNFFDLYLKKPKKIVLSKKFLDRWIVSRLEDTKEKVTELLEKFDLHSAAKVLDEFLDDFSRTWLKLSRERFQEKSSLEEKATFFYLLVEFTKLLAPFCPFASETIWQKLKLKPKSVHLADWPKANKRLIKKEIEEKMEFLKEVISAGLALRNKAKIKLRQPLALGILETKRKISSEEKEILKQALNLKEVEVVKQLKRKLENFETIKEKDFSLAIFKEISPELKAEGEIKDFLRQVQKLRSDLSLRPENLIEIYLKATKEFEALINSRKKEILKKVKAKKINFFEPKNYHLFYEKSGNFKIWIKKIS